MLTIDNVSSVFSPLTNPTTSYSYIPPPEEIPPPCSPTHSILDLPPIDYEDRGGHALPPKPEEVNGIDHGKSRLIPSLSQTFLLSALPHLNLKYKRTYLSIRTSGTYCTATELFLPGYALRYTEKHSMAFATGLPEVLIGCSSFKVSHKKTHIQTLRAVLTFLLCARNN